MRYTVVIAVSMHHLYICPRAYLFDGVSSCAVLTYIYTLFAFCTTQLPSLSLWSSKDTVQTSLPSSVDTVILSIPQSGHTTGQRRVVITLALPSLVQCTLFRVQQNTEYPSVEWTMYKHWMDTSFNVHTMYWATSPRAMQSSTSSFIPPGQS